MRRTLGGATVVAAAIGVLTLAGPSRAQMYPGGFGGYGWGGWGNYANDPGSEYLQGMGQYLSSQGDYDIKEQKAEKLRQENVLAWNKAMREANRRARADEAKKQAAADVRDEIERREQDIQNGTLLNQIVEKIIDFPAADTKTALAAQPLTPDALRAVAFEGSSAPISFCLATLTDEEGWPTLLKGQPFADDRKELADAADAALEEDKAGPVSDKTRQALDKAINDFHATLDKEVPFFNPEKTEADQFLRSLSAMVQLLEGPKSQPAVALLESYKEGSLADLVNFLHAFNLEFAPATSERQIAIYKDLYQRLSSIPTSYDDSKVTDVRPIEEATKQLGDAATQVFKNLSWADLATASSDQK